tara:strand:+ start:342 stop:1259 length:918 start_codon:yes stop_codon:yes gene_type:complete
MNGTSWKDFVDSLHEVEVYQKKVRSGHVSNRDKYLKGGPVATDAGGSGYKEKPPNKRSESAPPLGEEVEPESFDSHDTLATGIWIDGDRIVPKVAKHLNKIAQDFIDSLPVEIDIEDIRLTGSLANYNWSNYSDVDLHIIVDFLGIDENKVLVKAFFDNARMRWNNRHQIRMKGYDVEIYVEDSREQHVSSGVYSLMNSEWVTKPRKYRNSIDFPAARRKADDVEFQINIINNLITAKKLKSALKNVERVKRKIKNMRRAGLESTHKEFSIENIAFKILRRNGMLDVLDEFKHKIYDDVMTVKEE